MNWVPVVLPVGVDEQNVFQLQISVNEPHLVQEGHRAQQLPPEYLHLLQRKCAV